MTPTWYSEDEPTAPPLSAGGLLRAVLRGVPLALNTFGCLAILLLVRLIERPLFGERRPITPWITQYVCRSAFVLLGMGYRVEGRPMTGPGAIVANHVSWLDIFALNAPQRIYFVSKAEVAGWPGIGWLARATGTVFIRRARSDAAAQREMIKARLAAGHRLLFFPEGTSTDGKRVLPFRPTLIAAFFDDAKPRDLSLQPVSLIYTAPGEGQLLKVLCVKRPGSVRVILHEPVPLSALEGRKHAAPRLEEIVAAPVAEAAGT